MPEDLFAEIVHDLLTDQLHREGLPEFKEECDHHRGQEECEGNLADTDHGVRAEEMSEQAWEPLPSRRVQVSIDLHLHHVRGDSLQHPVEECGCYGERHHGPI